MMATRLSAKTWGPKAARVLTVYIESDNRYEIEDNGYADARILANKRGFSISNDVEVTEPTPRRLGGWVAAMQFGHQWPRRSH
jgi:hypothetical protein